MKKSLVILFVLFCYNSKAQITFPAHGAVWHYAIYNQNQTLQYTHDSLYMGKTVQVIENPYCFFTCAVEQQSKTLVYTSNDSVYFHNARTKNQWELLYSFNTPVGQSWHVLLKDTVLGIPSVAVTDTISFMVDSVMYVTINSLSLKKLCFTSKGTTSQGNNIIGYANYGSIYDRIGANTYLLPFPSAEIQTECPVPYLICYSDSLLGLYKPDTTSCNYVPSSGIKYLSINNEQVRIHPNPSNGRFVIETSPSLTLPEGKGTLMQVYDVNGKMVMSQSLPAPTLRHPAVEGQGDGGYLIDASSLSEGVYNISLQSNEGVVNKKLVIVK